MTDSLPVHSDIREDCPQENGRGRMRFIDSMTVIRHLLKAAAGPNLNDGERRVVMAIASMVSSYCRDQDRIYLAQLREWIGGDLSERWIGACLKKLELHGLISYTPGRGNRKGGTAGLIRVIPPPMTRAGSDSHSVETAEMTRAGNAGHSEMTRAASTNDSRSASATYRERLPREKARSAEMNNDEERLRAEVDADGRPLHPEAIKIATDRHAGRRGPPLKNPFLWMLRIATDESPGFYEADSRRERIRVREVLTASCRLCDGTGFVEVGDSGAVEPCSHEAQAVGVGAMQ